MCCAVRRGKLRRSDLVERLVGAKQYGTLGMLSESHRHRRVFVDQLGGAIRNGIGNNAICHVNVDGWRPFGENAGVESAAARRFPRRNLGFVGCNVALPCGIRWAFAVERNGHVTAGEQRQPIGVRLVHSLPRSFAVFVHCAIASDVLHLESASRLPAYPQYGISSSRSGSPSGGAFAGRADAAGAGRKRRTRMQSTIFLPNGVCVGNNSIVLPIQSSLSSSCRAAAIRSQLVPFRISCLSWPLKYTTHLSS